MNVTSAWNLYEIGQFCPHLIDLLTTDHSHYLSTGTGWPKTNVAIISIIHFTSASPAMIDKMFAVKSVFYQHSSVHLRPEPHSSIRSTENNDYGNIFDCTNNINPTALKYQRKRHIWKVWHGKPVWLKGKKTPERPGPSCFEGTDPFIIHEYCKHNRKREGEHSQEQQMIGTRTSGANENQYMGLCNNKRKLHFGLQQRWSHSKVN